MIRSDIQFIPKRGRHPVRFSVVHNLNEFDADIDSAVWSWANRTKDYSCKSFCDYVKSKGPQFKCNEAP